MAVICDSTSGVIKTRWQTYYVLEILFSHAYPLQVPLIVLYVNAFPLHSHRKERARKRESFPDLPKQILLSSCSHLLAGCLLLFGAASKATVYTRTPHLL